MAASLFVYARPQNARPISQLGRELRLAAQASVHRRQTALRLRDGTRKRRAPDAPDFLSPAKWPTPQLEYSRSCIGSRADEDDAEHGADIFSTNGADSFSDSRQDGAPTPSTAAAANGYDQHLPRKWSGGNTELAPRHAEQWSGTGTATRQRPTAFRVFLRCTRVFSCKPASRGTGRKRNITSAATTSAAFYTPELYEERKRLRTWLKHAFPGVKVPDVFIPFQKPYVAIVSFGSSHDLERVLAATRKLKAEARNFLPGDLESVERYRDAAIGSGAERERRRGERRGAQTPSHRKPR
mmetsp:Transcript_27592/g.69564  ORF Transcript_27592/g.69564 Transcript_27592/m.69564 type:complete len:297 (+) Transcript_27592:440-1330(+)